MANAKRDVNFVTVALGVTDDANLTPAMLPVDPSTGKLNILIVSLASDTLATSPRAKHDGNGETTAMAVTNDSNKTLENLRTHNGYLCVDFT